MKNIKCQNITIIKYKNKIKFEVCKFKVKKFRFKKLKYKNNK